jgi:TRAP-type C4-dicarboxylate transport system permease small subunit
LDAISEVVLLLFPWLTMLGASVALTTDGANVALHLFSGHASRKCRIILRLVTCVAAAVFGAFVIIQGVRYAQMTVNELSNVLEISRAWETAAYPVSGMLFIFFSIRTLVRIYKAAHLKDLGVGDEDAR